MSDEKTPPFATFRSSIWYALLLGAIRSLLSFLGGILVAHGVIDEKLFVRLTNDGATQVAIGVVMLGGVLWTTYRNQVLEFVRTHVALELPTPPASVPAIDAIEIVKVLASAQHDKLAIATGEKRAQV